jgi:hypothetical protein
MTDDEERMQRALNDAKRRELEERYGGCFEPEESALPPDVEAEWLESIEEFERLFHDAGAITVRTYIGNPPIRPLELIPEVNLRRELHRLMVLLEQHGIVVHFCAPVPDDEAYRFLTEELLDVETDDIHVAGLIQNYVYEEFHPNDVLDASFSAEVLLRESSSTSLDHLSDRFPRGTQPESSAEGDTDIFPALRDLKRGIASYLDFDVAIERCCVQGNVASAVASLNWVGLSEGSLRQVRGSARARVHLRKDATGEWGAFRLDIHPTDA